MNKKVQVVITLFDESKINLELYPDIAPVTVSNFLHLVDTNFYDGVIFHRIIKDFMVQTGGYYLDGNTIKHKEEVDPIVGEFSSNGHENNLKHTFGVISMARSSHPNSASSQFFICTGSSPHLDGAYAAFGKTVDEESNKVLEKLNHVTTTFIHSTLTDFPVPPITIKSIRRA